MATNTPHVGDWIQWKKRRGSKLYISEVIAVAKSRQTVTTHDGYSVNVSQIKSARAEKGQ